MPEPIYENDADRKAEEEIVTIYARTVGLGFKKLPMKNHIDFALTKGKAAAGQIILAFAEARDRPKRTMEELGSWGGPLFSLDKALYGFASCELVRLPLIFVVRCKGELWRTVMKRENVPTWGLIVYKGNKVRRREADEELCFTIPAEQFERVSFRG